MKRNDVNELLWWKLPDWMNDQQKINKIGNLLSVLRTKGIIENTGIKSNPKWSFLKQH